MVVLHNVIYINNYDYGRLNFTIVLLEFSPDNNDCNVSAAYVITVFFCLILQVCSLTKLSAVGAMIRYLGPKFKLPYYISDFLFNPIEYLKSITIKFFAQQGLLTNRIWVCFLFWNNPLLILSIQRYKVQWRIAILNSKIIK